MSVHGGRICDYGHDEWFVAFCDPSYGHGVCKLTRTSRASTIAARRGQGRPLGLLMSWLKRANGVTDEHAHKSMYYIQLATHGERVAEREYLGTLPGGAALMAFERAMRPDEEPEPLDVP